MRPLALIAVALAAGLALSGCTTGFFPNDGGRLGSAAKSLLDPRIHQDLVVEIDYATGYGPSAEAKRTLQNALVQVSGRDASRITFAEEAEIPVQAGKKYSLAEIRALEDAHRDRRSAGDTAVLYVLYLPGGYEEDTDDGRVLGIAYRGTSVALMMGNIKDASRGTLLGIDAPRQEFVERAVLVHEFGHAAGLVNIGTPMVRNHEDPNNPGHSSNRESVMYWAIETTRGLQSILSRGADIPYQFDADDIADLRALRDS